MLNDIYVVLGLEKLFEEGKIWALLLRVRVTSVSYLY